MVHVHKNVLGDFLLVIKQRARLSPPLGLEVYIKEFWSILLLVHHRRSDDMDLYSLEWPQRSYRKVQTYRGPKYGKYKGYWPISQPVPNQTKVEAEIEMLEKIGSKLTPEQEMAQQILTAPGTFQRQSYKQTW